MSDKTPLDISLRAWSVNDLPLLERIMGDAVMTEYLGGPESAVKIRERHARYCRSSEENDGGIFVIEVGAGRVAAGWIGYWETAWQGDSVWEMGWSVLPEFQRQGVATQGVFDVLKLVPTVGRHRFVHAFPSVDNAPSNAICRKAGLMLQGPVDFEYPRGSLMRCNDWRLELSAKTSIVSA